MTTLRPPEDGRRMGRACRRRCESARLRVGASLGATAGFRTFRSPWSSCKAAVAAAAAHDLHSVSAFVLDPVALWLLLARLVPPKGLRLGTQAHRDWIWKGAGWSGMLWGAGFVAMILLMLAFSGEASIDTGGERRSSSPGWIFPLVWTPYFVAEALLCAWRQPGRPMN